MKKVLFETDWLASRPVFYNELTSKASHNINDVIDGENIEFDPEGLNDYLDFGYSVFEQTPLKHVKFLRHSSRLLTDDEGKLSIEYLDDPTDKWLERRSSESEVVDLLKAKIQEWETSFSGDIIIPTSGGYDSRLLNWMVSDRSRIRSFTYGLSDNQEASFEAVYAKELSRILKVNWEQIILGDYHQYFDDWDMLFGISTHAHGMYQIEFYKKVLPKVRGSKYVLSGIIGDVWAGISLEAINNVDGLIKLGYSHGMIADSRMSNIQHTGSNRVKYYQFQKKRLQNPIARVIESMRCKMILLSYLFIVPESLGFKPWSPFLDIDVAMSMLTIAPERRAKRVWQQEMFQRAGIDIDGMKLRTNMSNDLNLYALRRCPIRPLNVKLLSEVIRPDYIKWINKTLRSFSKVHLFNRRLLQSGKAGLILERLGVKDSCNEILRAYFAYLVLRPIENKLVQREKR